MTESPRRNRRVSTIFGASAPNKGATGGSDDLLGDLVAKAQQGARGETGALELLERETEMRNLSKKSKTIIAGAAIAGLASAGGAYAYWTTTGHGTGGAATAGNTVVALTIEQSGTVTGLLPGGSAGSLKVKTSNSATYSQSIGDITATPIYPDLCGADNWTITHVSNGPTTVLATDSVDNIEVATVALKDRPSVNQNDCKSATVQFTFAG
jgi:hypothetical protein